MKNPELWQPTKYVRRGGGFRGSADRRQVGVGSRLNADITVRFYAENVRLHCRGRLLDLGCGNVPLYDVYKDHVAENVCIDWVNTFHKKNFLDHECDLTRPIPLPDAGFDTIILSDVLEHIPNPEALFAEIARLLRPAGKLLLNVPFYYPIHEAPYDFHRYTEFALRRLVETHGLTLVDLQATGGVPEVLADIIAKTWMKLPAVGPLLALLVQKVCQLFLLTPPGRGLSRKTAAQFPLGYFLVAQK